MDSVTDEMVEAFMDSRFPSWRNNWIQSSVNDEKDFTRQALGCALATRPRIAGDAVEAALDAQYGNSTWRCRSDGIARALEVRERERMTAAIEAADAARGHAMARWRKPEEFNAWAVIAPRNKHGDIEYLATRETDPTPTAFETNGNHPSMGYGMTAWAEMPTPPPWAETAPPVASTQAEASPGAQATEDAREASVAEPIWPEGCRNERSCVQHGKCDLAYFGHIVGDNCPHFNRDATPLRFIPPDDEAPARPLAPMFTKEIRELVRHLSSAVIVMTRHNNMPVASAKIARLKMAAFPDPAP